ncbi:bifunctional phosphoribosylaminoimidazolecarboxamide formyltransferase/IMP cyclohydrolase, partial [Candidatus Fermentibacterales bacterium]|nr:bifunctional phosphoribosylaminoimidazolecarboxamide formyltransferase/IMP cyclohydrolase [Candidatus Fermentibacterales bacterium]
MPDALISVYDKSGLDDLASGLVELGWRLFASAGTCRFLSERGIESASTDGLTGFESLLEGRVKTLHPVLHAGILARGDERERMKREGQPVFDMVVVDFYPFTYARERFEATDRELVELIDIGGPAMGRAAAKNWEHVLVVPGPSCYGDVLRAARDGALDADLRRRMASRLYGITALYDLEVSVKLEEGLEEGLRYGENPHQKAWLHRTWPPLGIGLAELVHGSSMSYNNYLDADAAMSLAADMPAGSCAAVIIKHGNPCGAALGDSPLDAFEKAFAADTVSPYGGILALNAEVDLGLVERLKGLFLELLIAPGFEEEALQRLRKRKKLRVLRSDLRPKAQLELRSVEGGILLQTPDATAPEVSSADAVTSRKPSGAEMAALDLAWRVCRGVRSNAIVVAAPDRILGIGAGQMSRIESLGLACARAEAAGLSVAGGVLASDGFFPFRDGVD